MYGTKARQDGSLFFHPELAEDADGDALYDADVIDRERKARDVK